jgi:acetyl esterase/lipase
VDDNRFARRRSALEAVNEHFATNEKADSLDAMDSFYQGAYALVSSPEAREAFNIEAEDPKLRDEYGRNQAGQRLLMAKRLMAAGVRVVTLTTVVGTITTTSSRLSKARCLLSTRRLRR